MRGPASYWGPIKVRLDPCVCPSIPLLCSVLGFALENFAWPLAMQLSTKLPFLIVRQSRIFPSDRDAAQHEVRTLLESAGTVVVKLMILIMISKL